MKSLKRLERLSIKVRVTPDKIKTYHINMLKKYHQTKEQRIENDDESGHISESEVGKDNHRIEQVAAIACVTDDRINENSEFEIEDVKELLPLYTVKQELSCRRESRPLRCFLTRRYRFGKIPIPTFEIGRSPIPRRNIGVPLRRRQRRRSEMTSAGQSLYACILYSKIQLLILILMPNNNCDFRFHEFRL